MSEFLAKLDRLVQQGRQEPLGIRVPPEQWEIGVRLGLLEPKEIPASKVRLALLGRLARREPLEQRARKGLKEMQALRDRQVQQDRRVQPD